jgi:hypothetical protein
VYVVAELLAGVAAALSFGLIAHTAQDNAAESAAESAVENAADTRPAEALAPAVPSEV